ncbi:MAG TPA: glycosyltransferase [Bryobacteraceae bacterium]|nr:glycosyltransferase [Bryobacteraceae bacterium]
MIWAIAAAACAYQALAVIACLRFAWGRVPAGADFRPPVSVLKPIYGLDDGLAPAMESHSKLAWDYELLCGVRSLESPAAALIARFPRARLIECHTQAPNGKVGTLTDLARAARHEVLIVNDADIRVEPDYIERVAALLSDPQVGLVTCLYRADGSTFAARFEALGVSCDFAPSVLVGWLLGMQEFAGGSTLAFRRADLDRIGGFQAIGDYLADDYQLGRRLRALGLKCALSPAIVSTRLGGGWREVWAHQVRWARTIRVSNLAGYATLPITFATLWAVVAAFAGNWMAAAGILGVRMIMALEAGWAILGSRDVRRLWFLIPLRDLFAAGVWAAGLFGRRVTWRGQRLRIDSEGRIRC